MRTQLIPHPIFLGMLRLYAASLVVGFVFGGLVFAFGSGPYRFHNAALVFIIWVALGGLYTMNYVATILAAKGVGKRHIYVLWMAFVILPVILISIDLPWGSLLFAALIPVALTLFREPKVREHAR